MNREKSRMENRLALREFPLTLPSPPRGEDEGEGRNESGLVLILVLGAMVLLSSIGLAFLKTTGWQTVVANNQLDALKVLYIAEAGAEDAIGELIADKDWRTGFTDKPFEGGAYTVTVIDDAVDILVSSTGTINGATRDVQVVVTSSGGSGAYHTWAQTTDISWFITPEKGCDSPSGPNGTFAKGNTSNNNQSYVTFSSGGHVGNIQKVELLAYIYLNNALTDDYMTINHRFGLTGTSWPHHMFAATLNQYVSNPDYLIIDVTSDHNWQFADFDNAVLRIEFHIIKIGASDKVDIFVDCTGYRITYASGMSRASWK